MSSRMENFEKKLQLIEEKVDQAVTDRDSAGTSKNSTPSRKRSKGVPLEVRVRYALSVL